jgi:hypothetical protein
MEFTLTHNVAPPAADIWVPVVGEQGYQFLLDLWERTGGTDDAISSIEIGELYEQGIQTSNGEDLESELFDVDPIQVLEIEPC